MKTFFTFVKYSGLLLIILTLSIGGGFLFKYQSERKVQLEIMESFETRRAEYLSLSDNSYTGSTKNFKTYLPGETVAILTLDRLDIKVSIKEGVDKQTLKLSAGHFPETALPGKGNFCIAGHSSFVYTCLFNDMHKAVLGDIIVVDTLNTTYTYEITDISVVEPTQVEVLDPSIDSILTIVTCTNNGNNRLIIRGTEI